MPIKYKVGPFSDLGQAIVDSIDDPYEDPNFFGKGTNSPTINPCESECYTDGTNVSNGYDVNFLSNINLTWASKCMWSKPLVTPGKQGSNHPCTHIRILHTSYTHPPLVARWLIAHCRSRGPCRSAGAAGSAILAHRHLLCLLLHRVHRIRLT